MCTKLQKTITSEPALADRNTEPLFSAQLTISFKSSPEEHGHS